MAAYFIVEITPTDPAGMAEYRELAAATVAAHGGRYLVRGGRHESMEGGWEPERVVMLEFASLEKAKAWYNSPEYQQALPLRLKSGVCRAIVIEGV